MGKNVLIDPGAALRVMRESMTCLHGTRMSTCAICAKALDKRAEQAQS